MPRFAWWKDATPDARRALVAAAFGWMLDAFDVMLYAMVLAAVMSDLGMSKSTAGLMGSLTRGCERSGCRRSCVPSSSSCAWRPRGTKSTPSTKRRTCFPMWPPIPTSSSRCW
ncbi:MAG: hypothetical protein R6X21_13160 [Candidatus Aminicenantes bacterium]